MTVTSHAATEEEQPPRFRRTMRVTDLTQDNLLNVVCSTEQGFNLKNVEQDFNLQEALVNRNIVPLGPRKDLIVVPIRNGTAFSGSLELYVNSDLEESQADTQEGIDYWMAVFDKYSVSLGCSFRHFMTQMINKLSYS
jgi:hypothetical protein